MSETKAKVNKVSNVLNRLIFPTVYCGVGH